MHNGDHVDTLIEQWRSVRPDLDVSPMEVIARISRLCRILERRTEAVYGKYGLNQAQFGVLAALRRAGPPYRLSPTALYNSLLISSGAMTNRLARLTAAGYVRRTPDPIDGRSKLVGLTPKGRRLIDRLLERHYETERDLLGLLSASERDALARGLREFLLQFEDYREDGGSRGDGRLASGRSSLRRPADSVRSRTQPRRTQGT